MLQEMWGQKQAKRRLSAGEQNNQQSTSYIDFALRFDGDEVFLPFSFLEKHFEARKNCRIIIIIQV